MLKYDSGKLPEKLSAGRKSLDNIIKDVEIIIENPNQRDILIYRLQVNFIKYAEFVISTLEHIIVKNKVYEDSLTSKEYINKGLTLNLYTNDTAEKLKGFLHIRNRIVHDYWLDHLEDDMFNFCKDSYDCLNSFYLSIFSIVENDDSKELEVWAESLLKYKTNAIDDYGSNRLSAALNVYLKLSDKEYNKDISLSDARTEIRKILAESRQRN